ncbi:Mitochondrial distribution and morphology protein 31 OS=Saccharomyces cerevisiae (strain ATCC 204508 / S288c) GN=MDM31 PE=1 SV=1 [Rhizoctonia solani AG-1 IB]|uniref:Mitochondrial distribution and morphology protein 31 n=1 Tax=Thanatephorus cucumeris (strain AG1-IB / isolate 7/3/14) TaxID=1108050 RepID=A0A0B7FVM6_THACB|nr:Mitochondrial distribution and morphology protein 31 OS=Saccharomyces cerevisiae (strain ATCC 204508 / S288c) GN=MDM31 PE=1 SV=1 [Rhizoctonia solani AG-1 IB]
MNRPVPRSGLLGLSRQRGSSRAADVIRYTLIRNFFSRVARSTVENPVARLPNIQQYRRHLWQRSTLLGTQNSSTESNYSKSDFTLRHISSSTKNDRSDPGSTDKSSPTSASPNHTPGQSSQSNVHGGSANKESQEPPKEPLTSTNPHLQNYSSLFRQLALSLPHVKQPTKQDFLQAATSMWQRMRIRFKWFAIKSFRKFNADDISAFLSWFLVGQTLWILVGTTTFFSVVFAVLNSLRLQEYVARTISDYLTSETGVRVVFESAVVPKWKDSRISFRNVYVSRRPDSQTEEALPRDAGQRAAARLLAGHHPAYHDIAYHDDEETHGVATGGMNVSDAPDSTDTEDDGWTTFDLEIDSVDVTLSFARWLEGRGLIKDAAVKGVRGVVDRRSVLWNPEIHADPTEFRHPPQLGDFELDSLEVEDLLVTLYQPGEFRPFTASIFRATFGVFRKQWLFYDLMCADHIVGQYDNCLFSLHTPQSIGRTMEQEVKDSRWTRMSRFRIDGVNIDHLQAATGNEGLVSWIVSGKVDAVLDIKFPRDPKAFDIGGIIEGIAAAAAEQIEEARRAGRELGIPLISDRIPGQRELAKPALSAPEDEKELREEYEKPVVLIDIDLRFRDLKAAMPLFTNELSYVNHALVRPIVSFINANRTLVPIRCKIVKDLEDFHGSWTMWETGLTDIISQKTYDAVAYHVTQANMQRRLKTVAMWNLHLASRNLITAARNIADPMSAHLRAAYAHAT